MGGTGGRPGEGWKPIPGKRSGGVCVPAFLGTSFGVSLVGSDSRGGRALSSVREGSGQRVQGPDYNFLVTETQQIENQQSLSLARG